MAVRFDASGDRLYNTANPPTASAYTICGWAVLDVDRNDYAAICSVEDGLTSAVTTQNLVTDADGTTLRIFAGGAFSAGSFVPGVGVPFFWSMTATSTGANGVTARLRTFSQNTLTSFSRNGNSFTPTHVFVGNDSYDEWLNGRVWNVKQWNRALSEAELLIESFYARPMFPASLNFWWPLHNANDTADRSGNGRNPTVGGTLATGDGPVNLWVPRRRIILPASAGGATNYSLTCDTGAYTLTGETATTSRGVRMTGDVGSYSLTGQNATTSRGYSITGDTGAYSLTGVAAGTQAGFRLVSDTGAYSLTGQDATLTYSQGTTNYTLTAETGDYTLTGVDAGTTAGRRLVADVGAYSLTGQSATTSKGTRLVADVGAYTLTGQDATLTATATVNYTLICETGDYSLSGVDAQLTYGTGANPFFPPYGLFWLPALEEEDLPEPVVEVIREVISRVIDEPKKESIAELKQALRAENIPFRKAYQDALLRVVEQARQAEEDEEEEAVAVALMSLL